jgi:hypothetical protein
MNSELHVVFVLPLSCTLQLKMHCRLRGKKRNIVAGTSQDIAPAIISVPV